MRVITTRTHGIIDYLFGLFLIAAPYLLGFADGSAAQWVPQLVGAAILGASLLTNYEYGALRLIPMPVHLALDIGTGILLAASPWLFGFADRVMWPHLILGLMEIGVALMTRAVPEIEGGTLGNTPATTLDR